MGYVVLHLEKTSGTDSAMSVHIERTIMPKNADPQRTHLNRELIEFPDGVHNRTGAIQYRLETAGLQRKIGKKQVRAVRIMLSGSSEDMKRIEQGGNLDKWCSDNLNWLRKTYGVENIVSAVLHLDETTPHIHATMIPIVTGERREAKTEQTTSKKKYRKKSTDTARLCADDEMSRIRLKEYQNTYAEQVAKYGLQRGIDGSEAKHVTTSQYYRDLLTQSESVQENIPQLLEQKEQAEQELTSVKADIKKEKLKNSTADVGAALLDGVGSLFGSSKFKTLERENNVLHQEVASHENTIDNLQTKIQFMMIDHSRLLLEIQQKHIKELANTETKHEISKLTALLNKILKWFPQIRDMLNLEKLCLAAGFNQEQTMVLMTGKTIEYSGELYSEEHKRKFMAKEIKAKICTDKGRFVLTIDFRPIGEWFKEQFDKLKQGCNVRQNPKQRHLKL